MSDKLTRTETTIDRQTGLIIAKKEVDFPAAFDEEKGYLLWPRREYVKSFRDVDYPEDLSDLDIGRLSRLIKKVVGNTNILGEIGKGGIRPFGYRDIAATIGLSDRQCARFIEKLVSLSILAKVKIRCGSTWSTQFYVNPIYFFASNRLPLNLYLIFRKQLDPVLPKWAIERFGEQARTDKEE